MDSSRKIEETAAAWLAQREAGHWPPSAQARLQAWLDQATAHRVAFLRLQSAWQESGRLAALGAGNHEQTPPPRGQWPVSPLNRPAPMRSPWSQTHTHVPPDVAQLVFAPRPQPAPAPRWLRPGVGAVALLLAVTTLGLGWRYYDPVETLNYQTGVGELRELPLQDGSHATLSSNSLIQVRLSRRERHIELQRGEAFFEVAKDPGRPFVVSVDAIGVDGADVDRRRVVAVGTRFAVRQDQAGLDPSGLRVVVTEGTVRLESGPDGAGNPQPTTLLPAGSVAIANRNGVLVRSGARADAERYVDWRAGFLTFHDTTLADAAAEFNRYNRRKIVIGDDAVGALRVGGNFRWSNTDVFVRLLEQGFPVQAEHSEARIVLRSL